MRRLIPVVLAAGLFWAAPAALAATAPSHPAGAQTVPMSPQMIRGRGTLTFHPQGEQVVLHLVARELPAPETYSLWLLGGPGGPKELAALKAPGGRAEISLTLPRAELREGLTVELVHQPSGSLLNERQAHPALSAKVPRI